MLTYVQLHVCELSRRGSSDPSADCKPTLDTALGNPGVYLPQALKRRLELLP